jgi:hypothetical protein
MQPFVEESKEVPCSEPEVGSASDLPPTSLYILKTGGKISSVPPSPPRLTIEFVQFRTYTNISV